MKISIIRNCGRSLLRGKIRLWGRQDPLLVFKKILFTTRDAAAKAECVSLFQISQMALKSPNLSVLPQLWRKERPKSLLQMILRKLQNTKCWDRCKVSLFCCTDHPSSRTKVRRSCRKSQRQSEKKQACLRTCFKTTLLDIMVNFDYCCQGTIHKC